MADIGLTSGRFSRGPSTAEALILRDGRWKLVVLPAHGGCLQLCEFDGVAVLKPTSGLERIGAPALSCCYFPLIPYSNRIENSRFNFAGAKVSLSENIAGTSHAMHGHGWHAAWQVDRTDGISCSISYLHEASSGWPWRYEGRQSFEILGNALRITLAIRNLAATAMPCGLGFHPFFPAPAGARLQLQAKRVWNGSVRDFPRQPVPVPSHLSFAAGALLADRLGTDHCFDGWQHRALVQLGDSGHDIVVEGCEATDFLVVYIPEGADYFCVEPVTHAVNAMNLPDPAAAGLWTLEPTRSRHITTAIHVQ